MPRRSRGSSGSRPAPPPTRAPLRNPPQPVARSPPLAPVQGGSGSIMGGFGAAVADGLAFGTGSAVAHRAVDAIMGPQVIQHETIASPATTAAAAAPAPAPAPYSSSIGDACGGQSKAFQECINSYGSDISKCQFYMDMLNECRSSSGVVMGA